ncbi:hypothetical protein OAA32_00640, partial [bacterium]|nr:hypothetical protein [bacterium]
MAGGLLQLVAYGAQDVYLTGNPQITFFKVVYRRHTNFAIESIEQTFNGTSSIGSRVSVLVTRNGDLINRIYYKGKITNTHSTDACALVPYFGLRLLKNIELEIGGQRIDKHYSEWMYIWNELSMPVGKKDGYDKMVGGNRRNSSISLSNGESYTLYVPLEFWFCRNVGLALPLIALQYHEVKINIEYAQLSDMVDITPGNFSYNGDDRETNDNSSHTSKSIELEDSELWVDYIFLDTDERRRFAQLSHEYLIEQLQFTGSERITSGVTQGGQTSLKSVKLNFNHPCKEIVWVVKPDAVADGNVTIDTEYRFTATASKPYWNNYSNNQYNEYNHYESANEPADYNCENPVKAVKLQLNGNERFSEREGEYFSVVQPYQHHENTPGDYKKGINLYSFALKPEEHQPSGTLNMSRIDSAHLQIATEKNGLINIFAVNYNVL